MTAVDESAPVPHAAEDLAAIPKGTLDPVYEAKARVLNHAVCTNLYRENSKLTRSRFKKLGWGGTSGNCSSSLVLVGQTTISGRLSPLSSVSTPKISSINT